jgi:hypothetical protein
MQTFLIKSTQDFTVMLIRAYLWLNNNPYVYQAIGATI